MTPNSNASTRVTPSKAQSNATSHAKGWLQDYASEATARKGKVRAQLDAALTQAMGELSPSATTTMPTPCACACQKAPRMAVSLSPAQKVQLIFKILIVFGLGVALYFSKTRIADGLVMDVLGWTLNQTKGQALHFLIEDLLKIGLLLLGLVYVVAWLRANLEVERVAAMLQKLPRFVGYSLGSLLGAVTPFCSCSSIPLFMGFTSAGIPIGMTMSFLITSPLINEVAVVMLVTALGWKITFIYVVVGLLAGIIGGMLMDRLGAQRWLQPFMQSLPQRTMKMASTSTLTWVDRHHFAYQEMVMIFKRVWLWIVVGVALGAAIHGYIPQNWFDAITQDRQWWNVPLAVLAGIPLYTNVTGIVPVMEALLTKGLPVGTVIAFCMSSVAASVPEFIMLKKMMTVRLLALFFVYLWVFFTLVGWLLNALTGF